MTASAQNSTNVGSLCHCGHGMYEHYMCGEPWTMRCYRRGECGCDQYVDRQLVSASRVDEVRRSAAERRAPKRRFRDR